MIFFTKFYITQEDLDNDGIPDIRLGYLIIFFHHSVFLAEDVLEVESKIIISPFHQESAVSMRSILFGLYGIIAIDIKNL